MLQGIGCMAFAGEGFWGLWGLRFLATLITSKPKRESDSRFLARREALGIE